MQIENQCACVNFRTLQNEVYDLCAAQWSDTEIIVMGGNIFNEDFLDLVAVLVSDTRKKNLLIIIFAYILQKRAIRK